MDAVGVRGKPLDAEVMSAADANAKLFFLVPATSAGNRWMRKTITGDVRGKPLDAKTNSRGCNLMGGH